jgi:hypothetical protein
MAIYNLYHVMVLGQWFVEYNDGSYPVMAIPEQKESD